MVVRDKIILRQEIKILNRPIVGGFNFNMGGGEGCAIAPLGAHGEYADEQITNLQKRICLIEFLHIGLVVVRQEGFPIRHK